MLNNKLQGSVATHLRCDEIFNYCFITEFTAKYEF